MHFIRNTEDKKVHGKSRITFKRVLLRNFLTEVVMKSFNFWDIMPYNRLKARSSCYLLHAGLFLRLFFDLEDGGDIFPRNVG
jgi:hypothetical protein